MNLKLTAMKAALDLYREKPWDLFEEHEVFELNGRGYAKDYCIFHKKHGKRCITIFEGVEAFTDVSNHFKPSGMDKLDAFLYLERECFEILFDVPDALDEEDKKIGEELDLSLREIPLIWFYQSRCYPDHPTEIELERLIVILSGLKDALNCYLKNGLDLDFFKHRFVYHIKKKTYSSKRTGYRPHKYDLVEIDDPILLDELKESERIKELWEFDLAPTELTMSEEKNGRLQPVYMAALASIENDQILSAVPFVVHQDFQFQCIDLIIEAIIQRGIPYAVSVRHPLVGSAIVDLCKKLDIKLATVDHFEVLDDFYGGLASFMEAQSSC